jgi:hypothetical protein
MATFRIAAVAVGTAATFFLFQGCEEGGPAPCTAELASLRQQVFTSCLGGVCHGAGDPVGALDLESEGVEARLVGASAATCERTLVIPGDPGGSFLFEKIASPSPACGLPMPLDGPLAPELVACVHDWIVALEGSCETCGGTTCIDFGNDPAHCGGCGEICPAETTCQGGVCACAGGALFCGGGCVDSQSDAAHCGECDAPCTGGLLCSLGACKETCDAGLVPCGGGCIDTTTSSAHCGNCDAPCAGGEVCSGGSCACPDGADTQTDPDNCGSCGHVCSPGQSCVGGACTCGTSTVSFAADIQPIFNASCTGSACHDSVSPAASLELTAGKAYGELVGVPTNQCNGTRTLVIPGDPENSYLLDKILGVDMCFGSKMPKMSSLSPSEIENIVSWICAGASDN